MTMFPNFIPGKIVAAAEEYKKKNPRKVTEQEYGGPDDFRIKGVSLKPASGGKSIDMTNIFVSLQLYESIFSNTMSGEFTFLDTGNVPRKAPIIGQREEIMVEYETPGAGMETFKMYSYSVPQKVLSTSGRKQVYSINAVPDEAYKDMHTKISKCLSGTITDMIEEVFKNYIKGNSKKELRVLAETSDDKYKFLIPYWTPFQTINWLCSRAIPKDKPDACNFIFYEDRESWKFTTLEELYKQDPPAMEYRFYPTGHRDVAVGGKGVADRDQDDEFINVSRFTIDESGDRMKQIMNGMFASNLLTHDIVKKEFKYTDYNFNDSFSKTEHLEKNYPLSKRSDEFSDKKDSLFLMRPKHSFMHCTKNKDDKEGKVRDNDKCEKWLLKRTSLISQISNKTLTVTVSGDSRIKVGDVVFMSMNSIQQAESKYDLEKEPLYSGRYLITELNHRIHRDGYEMTMTLSKDSEYEQISDVARG